MCRFLGISPASVKLGSFADGEVSIRELESVRGKDVYVVQSVCRSGSRSVNDALVELLLMISAIRRAAAGRITAILPYYAYARQDRKMEPRVPISAADVAVMLTSMGVDRVVGLDLHCGQIEGFFPPTVPVTHVSAVPVGAAYFSEKDLVKPVVVSPDAGGVNRAKQFRHILEQKGYAGKTGLAMIVKQRSGASQIASMDLVGNVKGCDAIICDDMVDTAGTLCKAAAMLKEAGARRVMAFCTHGLFSGPAPLRVAKSVLDEIVVSNSVFMNPDMHAEKRLKVLSLAPLLAETIHRLHLNLTVSTIFEPREAKEKVQQVKAAL